MWENQLEEYENQDNIKVELMKNDLSSLGKSRVHLTKGEGL